MSSTRRLAVPALALTAVLLLAGCAAETPVETLPSEVPVTPSTEPVPVPAQVEETFTLPADCITMLPEDRIANFETQGLALLGGPDGKYGTDYLADPTPEESAGGITCIWGFDDTDFASVTISVAPLTEADRAAVETSLLDQGLNESTEDTSSTFVQQGDADSQPAIINVVSNDSWISVIETVGGEEFFAEAALLASEVRGQIYTIVQ